MDGEEDSYDEEGEEEEEEEDDDDGDVITFTHDGDEQPIHS
jgi:hypothetical protein